MESLDRFRNFVLDRVKKSGVPQEVSFKIELVLEELLANVIHYAYPQGHGDLEVGCELGPEQRLCLSVQDWGRPFNPLTQEDPNLSPDLCERAIGGLGIFLVRKMADSLSYKRQNDSNILTLFFQL